MANIRRDGEQPSETPVPAGIERLDPFRLMNEVLQWDPLRGLRQLRAATPSLSPDFDVKETPDGYVIEADVPGMRDKDLDVSVAGNRLVVSGKRETRREEKGEQYYTLERQFGSFMRTFTLPEGIDSDHIDATVDVGVLRITIPKTERHKPRKIGIKERVKQALKS
jgi:HSP20 family protein